MNYIELVDILAQNGTLENAQAQILKIRHNAIRASFLREKGANASPSAVELLIHAGASAADGTRFTEKYLARVLSEHFRMPFVEIDPLLLDSAVATKFFSHSFAKYNVIIPLKFDNNVLSVAIDDPSKIELKSTVARGGEFDIVFFLATKSDILNNIDNTFSFKKNVVAASDEQKNSVAQQSLQIGNLEQYVSLGNGKDLDASDSHIVNATDYILRYALSQRASDIHIEPKREKSLVRLRIDGVLHTCFTMPVNVHAPIVSRLKLLARLDIAEKRRPQDGRFKIRYEDSDVEMRLSNMPVAFGEKTVLRILNASSLSLAPDVLGFEPEELAIFKNMIESPTGLIIITGPTGSGKTTTLYSALNHIDSPARNIATIEDPIEMVVDNFNQVQVNTKIGLDFAHILRNMLRQDPDVIMIGEIRDAETALMATQAALTGHLVLTTLHTNDAPSAVARMLDLGVKPFLLSGALSGVVAQRLLKKICPDCKQQRELTPHECEMLDIESHGAQLKLRVCEGKGCNKCRGTGFYGQSAVYELLPATSEIKALIHESAPTAAVRAAAIANEWSTMQENAVKKLARGETALSELLNIKKFSADD